MAQDDARLNQLKQKYASVINSIPQLGIRLANLHVENNKLLIRGTAPSQEAKNKLWDQIKLVDPGFANDLVADIDAPAQAAAPAAPAAQTYTVQAGDSLSKIAKQFYGDANQYMKIFNANTDKLKDPNVIHPGQVLTIPA